MAHNLSDTAKPMRLFFSQHPENNQYDIDQSECYVDLYIKGTLHEGLINQRMNQIKKDMFKQLDSIDKGNKSPIRNTLRSPLSGGRSPKSPDFSRNDSKYDMLVK